jgi:acyl-CoA synthetase (NDP forming)
VSLDALFHARSAAVFGASATDPAKLGNVLLRNAATGGALDDVIAVHPTASEIDGHRAVSVLDRAVDLALVSVAASAVPGVVARIAGFAKSTIVLSSGFGEAGDDGRATEGAMVETVRAAGGRVVGPNCMGVVSRSAGNDWLNGTYFWSVPLQPGPIGFVSQSGAFGGMFFSEVRRRGLGLSRFLSIGNAADVNVTDVVEWLGDDDGTEIVAVFAEAIPDGRRFVEVARTVAARKPLLVLKSGKSSSGARAAASHTGSMAGRHAVVQAAFRRAGVIEADTTDDFFDRLAVLSCTPHVTATARATGDRLAIVTISGGPSVLAADEADRLGLVVPDPSAATVAAVRAAAPSFAASGNPIDLTPQCPPDGFAPAVDAIIDCGLDRIEFGDAVARAARRTGKRTTAYLLDVPGIAKVLADAGIAVLDSPERAVRAWRR